jgi:hypothetical protein
VASRSVECKSLAAPLQIRPFDYRHAELPSDLSGVVNAIVSHDENSRTSVRSPVQGGQGLANHGFFVVSRNDDGGLYRIGRDPIISSQWPQTKEQFDGEATRQNEQRSQQ